MKNSAAPTISHRTFRLWRQPDLERCRKVGQAKTKPKAATAHNNAHPYPVAAAAVFQVVVSYLSTELSSHFRCKIRRARARI